MAKRMDEYISYLKRTRYPKQVLRAMGPSIWSPERLASKLDLEVRTVKAALNRLKDRGLVKKSGSSGKRGLYEPTAVGKAALKMKTQWGCLDWKGTSRQRRIARGPTTKKG